MTIIEAIIQVMKDSGKSLSTKEAYDKIIEKNLYNFKAQNPKGIVAGQIRRHCINIDFPSAEGKKYFEMDENGRFFPLKNPVKAGQSRKRNKNSKQKEIISEKPSLSNTFEEIKSLQIQYRQLLKDRILKDLKSLSPVAFEHFAKKLLEAYGFQNVKVTTVTNDGGIDGHGKLKVGLAYMRVAFQCKRWTKSNVGRPEIDRFRGAIQGEFEQGLFFTTAGFVEGAKKASIKPGAVPVILIDGPGIIDFMIEKQFGVSEEPISIHTYALDTVISDEN